MRKVKIKDLFPERLWTGGFTYWWIVSLATMFMFDIFWMMQTTFRPMSYFAFYPVIFLCAFFLALPSLISRNGVLQALWLLFFDLLFIANLMYCRTYYNAIPLHSYGLAGNLSDFHASVADSFKWYFIFLPVLTLVAFSYYLFSKRISKKLPSPLLYFLYVCVLAIITWAGDAWRGGIMKRMEWMSNYAYLSSSITPIYSLGGFLIHDYYKTNEKLTEEDSKKVNDWLEEHKNMEAAYWNDSTRVERKAPKNLVLILCESLESWVIGTKVEGKELTPNINEWIADSTTFYAPHIATQVGAGRSIDGQLLILSGLMPMKSQAYAYDAVENDFFTLPKAMKEEGANTFLFTCDKPYVWNQALVAKAFGIDSLIYAKDFKIDETAGPSRRLSDGSFMKQISEKLENDHIWDPGEKAMIVAVTYSGHNPFKLPKELRKIDLEGNYPEIIKDFMVTANYTDASLKTLIDYLKSRPDWEETMVVITGDHEGLASDRKTAMENPLTKEFVDPGQHTPLIILNSPKGGTYNREMGQVDIYSTLLDLMNLYQYPWKGLGFSAFDPSSPGFAFGSTGELSGDISSSTPEMQNHVQEAKTISDLILKFNLLHKNN